MVNGMFRLRSDWEKVAGQTWSTRPFCRPVRLLKNTQDPEKPEFSNLARLSLRTWRTARLGRASRGSAKDRQGIGKAAWESGGADRKRGEPPVENALLIGLSRQTTLERHLGLIANNLANVNTNGFKGDQTLFEEYLSSGAHEDNFRPADRRVSYVQDRGSFHDLKQGALERTGNPLDIAISGDGFLTVQSAGGERYTRDGNLQVTSTGQLVTNSGEAVLGTSGPIVFQPTDHDITISQDGTVTVLEGASRRIRSAASCASRLNRAQTLQMDRPDVGDEADVGARDLGRAPRSPPRPRIPISAISTSVLGSRRVIGQRQLRSRCCAPPPRRRSLRRLDRAPPGCPSSRSCRSSPVIVDNARSTAVTNLRARAPPWPRTRRLAPAWRQPRVCVPRPGRRRPPPIATKRSPGLDAARIDLPRR